MVVGARGLNLRSVLFACVLALVGSGAAGAAEPKLTNDDLCGTSLLGDEGSQGRSDGAWNRRLEDYFRGGGGLALRHEKIAHEGPPASKPVVWVGSEVLAGDGTSLHPPSYLRATRYEVAGRTIIGVTVDPTEYVSTTVFTWLEPDASRLAGAAVLVSNDFAEEDDNGYFLWSWNDRSTGSVTLEMPRWPWSGGPRLAVDLAYTSKRIGVSGDLRALVAIDRVPEGDPARIGRFLRDAGIVRAPCLHQDLDPDAIEEARREMERDEALAVIRAAAEFVALDAEHAAPRDAAPAELHEVRCAGGRVVASARLFVDSKGVARQLSTMTTRAGFVDDAVYSYDEEGRLRFVRVESEPRPSAATGTMEIWYDEVGHEAGSRSGYGMMRPRPGTDPHAEMTWIRKHEAELRGVCEPGW